MECRWTRVEERGLKKADWRGVRVLEGTPRALWDVTSMVISSCSARCGGACRSQAVAAVPIKRDAVRARASTAACGTFKGADDDVGRRQLDAYSVNAWREGRKKKSEHSRGCATRLCALRSR